MGTLGTNGLNLGRYSKPSNTYFYAMKQNFVLLCLIFLLKFVGTNYKNESIKFQNISEKGKLTSQNFLKSEKLFPENYFKNPKNEKFDAQNFLNYGVKRLKTGGKRRENEILKSKVEVLGRIFEKHVNRLRHSPDQAVELVFLVDSSASVGPENFYSELKFVKKLLSDFTVSFHHTRVAVITFADKKRVIREIDHITHSSSENHKCSLLKNELPTIEYHGGGTYTMGALLEAQSILAVSRTNATKVIFLVTDGYSNGGDPRPAAEFLKNRGVVLFTFGIHNGNVKELYDMASEPKEEHSYILNSFEEFEALARRALHQDLHNGLLVAQHSGACSNLCKLGYDCCDRFATCKCGVHTGQFSCVCRNGYYGTGLKGKCKSCPPGTYKNIGGESDISGCKRCPDPNMEGPRGAHSPAQCICKRGFVKVGDFCKKKNCADLAPPPNGNLIRGSCDTEVNAACGMGCRTGYELRGSSIRLCRPDGLWSGVQPSCKVRTCKRLKSPKNGAMICSSKSLAIDTQCHFMCDTGYQLIGSKMRTCLPLALWDGIRSYCRPIFCHPLKPIKNGAVTPSSCSPGKLKYGTKCRFGCRKGYRLSGAVLTVCGDKAKWTVDSHKVKCIDVDPPTIICPKTKYAVAEKNENFALVSWPAPVATDSSGGSVYVMSAPVVSNAGTKLKIGRTYVTYVAKDTWGNRATCDMKLVVIDEEPPKIDWCQSPPPFVSPEPFVDVVWEEPQFSDNSGNKLKIRRSRNPGKFAQGETVVEYSAYDQSGNVQTCNITITVQEHTCGIPKNPIHGKSNCTEDVDFIMCSVICDSGYSLPTNFDAEFFCAFEDGVWFPEIFYFSFPPCSETEEAKAISQDVEISIEDGGILCVSEFNSDLHKKFEEAVTEICPNKSECEISDFELVCEQILEENEENSNSIGFRRRKKRSNKNIIGFGTNLKDFTEDIMDFNKSLVNFHENITDIAKSLTDLGDYDQNIIGSDEILAYFIENVSSFAENITDLESFIGKATHFTERLTDFTENVTENVFDFVDNINDVYENSNNPNVTVTVFSENITSFSENISVFSGNITSSSKNMRVFSENLSNLNKSIAGLSENVTDFSENLNFSKNIINFNGNITNLTDSNKTFTKFSKLTPNFSEKKPFSQDNTNITSKISEMRKNIKIKLKIQTKLESSFGKTDLLTKLDGHLVFDEGELEIEEITLSENFEFICPTGSVSMDNLCVKCPIGSFFNIVDKECQACPVSSYQPMEGQISCFKCPQNTSTTSSSSMSLEDCRAFCLSGTFSQAGLEPCTTCEIGFYEYKYGSTGCRSCPNGTTTFKRGAFSEVECLSPCLPEMISLTGLVPCFPCPVGYFQPEYGQKECSKCPVDGLSECQDLLQNDHDTTQLETISLNDCFSMPCENNATCVPAQTGYLCVCTSGYFGLNCADEINECESEPCLNNGQCEHGINSFVCTCAPGFEGPNCEMNRNDCEPNPCKNNASCTDLVDYFQCICEPGFTGEICDVNIDDCPKSGCANDSVCVDKLSDFECQCKPGYDSRHCDVEINECLSYPCIEGRCIDLLNDYRCLCTAGFTGRNCEHEVNECDLKKCQNNATCIDQTNSFSCECLPGFTEKFCERSASTDFVLEFPTKSSVVNYVIQKLEKNFDEFSLCFWMRSSDVENYGTVFSYATDTYDNALTLTDYNGFVLYVNNERRITDFSANDGRWHMVCATWEKSHGNWSILKDGGLFASGSDLSAGKFIEGGGTLILGQEQDEKRGGFSAPESFVGELTLLNIWNEILPQEKISSLYKDCSRYVGDMRAWSDFRSGVMGGVKIKKSPFCSGCRKLKSVPNSKIIYEDSDNRNYARVKCDPGYVLGKNHSIQECLIDGTWSGTTGFCIPKSCDLPSAVKNGDLTPRLSRYVVGNFVTYFCKRWFKLHGKPVIHCQTNGTWSGETPRCKIQRCSNKAPKILNGGPVTHLQSYLPTNRIWYVCEEGYRMDGPGFIECGPTGHWSANHILCQPKYCTELPIIKHGTVNIINPQRTSITELLTSKQVIPSSTEASETSTETVVTSKEAILTQKDLILTSTEAVLTCDFGFKIRYGRAVIKCDENGVWEHPFPKCVEWGCSDPPRILNGKYQIFRSYSDIGKIVKYICNHGYVLKGPASIKCTNNAWNVREWPICERQTCSFPEVPKGFKIPTVKEFFVGDNFTYECKLGYRIKDSPEIVRNVNKSVTSEEAFKNVSKFTRYCIAGNNYQGDWLGNVPECEEIRCYVPKSIEHGNFLILEESSVKEEKTKEIIDDESKQMAGKTKTINNIRNNRTFQNKLEQTVTENLQNTNDNYDTIFYPNKLLNETISTDNTKKEAGKVFPKYLKFKSTVSSQIVNVSYSQDNFSNTSNPKYSYGVRVMYLCNEGYHSTKKVNLVTCAKNGWIPKEPKCVPVLCPVPVIKNGILSRIFLPELGESTVAKEGFSGNSLVELTTISNTNNLFLDSESGHLMNEIFYKTGNHFDKEKFSNDSRFKKFLYKTVIQIDCKIGYKSQGVTKIVCQSNGIWDHSPTCFPIECPVPSQISHGRTYAKSTMYKAIASYICDEGYRIEGNTSRKCLASKNWSGTEPKCLQILCKEPPNVLHATKIVNSLKIGSTAEYNCFIGYKIVGKTSLFCKSDGFWDRYPPKCKRIHCKPLKLGLHLRVDSNNTIYNSRVKISCHSNFTLQGPAINVCLLSGQWMNKTPICV